MTKSRLNVIYYYLFNDKNNVPLWDIIKLFFGTSYNYKANKIIKFTEKEDKWIKFYFKGFDNQSLFFPKDFSRKSLEQVVVETFYKDNWHYYELEQTRVKENDIVVDCGAAEGLFSFIIKDRCKYVYIIEPLKKFIECLLLTFKNVENIKIIDKALSDHQYRSFINDNGISSSISDSKKDIEVNVTTLDHLFLDEGIPISYIKMDLEGFDFLALQGGAKLIEKYMPKIAVTTYHNINHFNQIKKLLLDINPNYKILSKGIYGATGSPIMLHAWI